MAKPALGRGLSALLGGKPPGPGAPAPVAPPASGAPAPTETEAAPGNPALRSAGDRGSGAPAASTGGGPGPAQKVAVGMIRPSGLQPRRDFPPGTLQELADSIREQGILQPLVVRPQAGFFELIAGERRWRAAQIAGLAEVPVVVREADDTTALELMLVENLQREDLNPVDEAQGYLELMERFRMTQDAVATRVGRSRASVANALRLLRLPASIQGFVRQGRISTGHAKVLMGLPDPEMQAEAAKRVLEGELSVRQAEELVARLSPPSGKEPGVAPAGPGPAAVAVPLKDPHVAAMEDRLRHRLGTKVHLRYKQGKGQIDIRFFSDDELERVLDLLGVPRE